MRAVQQIDPFVHFILSTLERCVRRGLTQRGRLHSGEIKSRSTPITIDHYTFRIDTMEHSEATNSSTYYTIDSMLHVVAILLYEHVSTETKQISDRSPSSATLTTYK